VAHPVTPPAPARHPAQLPSGKMASCTVFKGGHATDVSHRLGQISNILEEEGTLVWYDVVYPGPNDLDVLRDEFDLHPLAIEDAVHAHQRPKIESYGRYWFLDVQATTLHDEAVDFHEIAIFAGTNFIVTVRHDPEYPLDEIKERWNAHPEGMKRGAGFLLYTILDTIVDGYMPVGEVFADKVDDLEERLFRKSHSPGQDQILPQIFSMKKDAQHFRRAVLPMRDILNPIIRKDIELFPEEDLDYFRDVYDHSVLVMDQLDSLRDIVNSALEIHLSVVGNRQNEVAKQLTIIATIFLPLTFLTGFFGQNFGFLVNSVLTHNWTFWVLGIGIEVVALFITLGYFKLKGWF
jgi:magnesium transporter